MNEEDMKHIVESQGEVFISYNKVNKKLKIIDAKGQPRYYILRQYLRIIQDRVNREVYE